MARHDIMPFSSPRGGHTEVHHFSIGIAQSSTAATTAFRAGNVVILDAAVGDVNAATNGTLEPGPGLHFLALVDSAAIILTNSLTDPVAAGEAAMVPCISLGQPGQAFITSRVYSNSDTAVNVDTGIQVGDTGDLWVDNATVTSIDTVDYGFDDNGNFFTVTRKLDALGRDALISGSAATQIVFEKISHLVA